MTLRFSVFDAPDFPGLYCWELSDRGITESGFAPTISRCLTEIAGARLRINHAVHSDPELVSPAHPAPDAAPIAEPHPPDGNPLPTQLNIPSTSHYQDPSTSFYLHPSKSG